MSGVGITYLWLSNEFPPFIRLEGKRGDYEVYVPERTCHIVKTWGDSDYASDWRYRCSECGRPIPVYERDPETGDVISAANYCPNCGAKVIMTRRNEQAYQRKAFRNAAQEGCKRLMEHRLRILAQRWWANELRIRMQQVWRV